MATIRETILNIKPGESKKILLSEINSPMSFKQEACEINRELRLQGVPMPEGKRTYYEVSIIWADSSLTITNNQSI